MLTYELYSYGAFPLALVFIFVGVTLLRSILNNRQCKDRDSDFRRCVDYLRSGDLEEAGRLSRKHKGDPVFNQHIASAAKITRSFADVPTGWVAVNEHFTYDESLSRSA